MVFDTLQYFVFFAIIYALYFCLPRYQKVLLLIASLAFYALWDPRLLFLLLVSAFLTHLCAVRIERTSHESGKKRYLIIGLAVPLGVLAAAKFCYFLMPALRPFEGLITVETAGAAEKIIIPLGISFFAFQMAGYIADVYRARLAAVKSFPDYLLYTAFFPIFVAGPVEKAGVLVPQILEPRRPAFEKFSEGVYLILWGLFQKLFIADNLAPIAFRIFSADGPYDTFSILGSLYAFAFYLYGLLAGYANIGRGTAKLLGIELTRNFELPFFSSGLVEFWRRWNVGLSLWLRDYVYLPLGGSARGSLLTARNLAAAFLLGCLWYGTGWPIVLWGCYHFVLILAARLFRGPARYIASTFDGAQKEVWLAVQTVLCFHLTAIGWIFFAASSVGQAAALFQGLLYLDPVSFGEFVRLCGRIAVIIAPLFLVELFQKLWEDHFILFRTHWLFQGVVYFTILFLLIVFGAGGHQSVPFFIY